MDVERWLRDLGLPQYSEAFLSNDIDAEVLLELQDEELEKLGVKSLGHRKRLLKAIGALKEGAPSPAPAEAPPTTRPRDPERRHLTVMFCDLVGSTSLAEQLDPEDLRELIRAYQDACAGVVSRFEGYVAEYVGDGLLICFGYPKAHEDDAERAIRSGLGILAVVGALQTRTGESLAVRIGIATGLVVIGDIVGERTSQEKAVIGETPNLAARLQGTADPNCIVISPATRDLARGQFYYEDLGPQTLKGINKPLRSWRVTGERAVETRFLASHSDRLAALVGREQERELLLERWRRAVGGEGQLVMLSGDAGIGKSRITEALQQQIKNEDRWSVHYQCSPHHVNSPLYPAIQQLQFAAAIERDDSNEAKLGKIEDFLVRSGAIIHLRFVSALLSIDASTRCEPLTLSPLEIKQQTLKALVSIFERLAAQRPALFVLEDVHWIDPTTRELMDILADRVGALRALIVVTHRPEFKAPWTNYAHCTALALGRLSRTACASLINDVTGGRALPAEVLDQLISKADGVPLFLEELTKTVLESDLLVAENGSYALSGPLPPLAIPSTLQDSLMARLDRLDSAKETAQIGAAIGREFSHDLLEAVSPLKGAPLNAALETLIHSQIMLRRGTPPDATYVFKHALIQDTAYDTLLRARRQQIHARIAQVMKAVGEVEPEMIGHHFTHASLYAEAAPEWLRAGQQAVARSANIEAIAHLTRGLDAVRSLPTSEQIRSIELDMQISLGSAQIAARGYSAAETERAYARARELLPETVDDARTFAVLHGLAMVYWNKAQLRAMRNVADDMLTRAQRQGERVPTLVAHRVMTVVLNTTGRFEEASQHGARAVSLHDREQDHETAHVFGHDQGVGALCHFAIAQTFLGKTAEAKAAAMRAAELARFLNNANTLLYNSLWSSFISVVGHHWTQAHETATDMVAEAEKRSMALWAVFGRHFLGCSLVGLGAPEAGLAELHRGRSDAAKLENRIFLPITLSFEAQALAALGQNDKALSRLEEALRVIVDTQEHWWEAEVHRIQGEIMLANGSAPADCNGKFRRAVEIASLQGAKLLEQRARDRMARLLELGREPDQLPEHSVPGL
jgi:class 3 adenylate cyclase/tetratricopeptide (TPR) repeat protein